FLEEHGETPDKKIENDEVVNLHEFAKHFYSEVYKKRPIFYAFFVDAARFEIEHATRTGAEIKEFAKALANYQLFLEEEGDRPDKVVPDHETVVLSGSIKHFYLVP